MPSIELRGVPEDVLRILQARAAAQGTSLSAYVLKEVTRVARTPTLEELDARLRARGSVGVSIEDILAARDEGRRA